MQSPPTPSRSADHRDVLPEHAEGHGDKLFEAVCKLGLEGIVSKKLNAPYRSGPSKYVDTAATRAIDGTF